MALPHSNVVKHPGQHTSWPGRYWLKVVDFMISIALMGLGVYGISTLLRPPSTTSPSASTNAVTTDSGKPYTLNASVPTHLDIPDIGVSTNLIQLGKNKDGSLETPTGYDVAGWYKYSPTPGELGPAIIAGHVDNYLGPAVFFRLKELKAGQVVHIDRQDGSKATFAVDRVEEVDQNAFPTDEVYGNIDHAGLRLITCGGIYNPVSGRYNHNIVVFASLRQ